MDMYSFVPPFREAKFCGVPSCVFDNLGCAAGEKCCGTLHYTKELVIINCNSYHNLVCHAESGH
jgi:hypothetical protein